MLDVLVEAYPDKEIKPGTVEIYIRCLADLPYEAVQAAVLQHITSNKWFPTISELRELATGMLPGNQIPTATEAWAEVKQAFAKVGYYGKPEWSHPALAKTVEAMGWQSLCMSENDIADRAHFIRLYEVYVKRLRDDQLELPEVTRLRGELAKGETVALPDKIKALADAKRVKP
ncbi:MAG: hypothetical protein C4551_01915 [Bacillota bacterium]|nr:MAG: hypothetical protein C4551_01915 [Bacillota bacterium]